MHRSSINQRYLTAKSVSFREISAWFLLAAIGGSLMAYVYFINQAVRTTLMQGNVALQSEEINAKIGKHEKALFTVAASITIEAADYFALQPLEPTFVPREEAGPVLSLRGNER